MALPSIIFIHGAWHFGAYFHKVQDILESKGYRCVALDMPSVGRSPPVTSFDEDIKAIRSAVLSELDAGHDVITHTHSWGGLPTCSALDGLSKAERKEQGHSTGVIRLTFASSFMVSENLSLSDVKALAGHTEPEPWLKFLDDGNVVAEDVYENMYHDVEREEADKYISRLRPHSMYTFAAKTRSAAWRKIPVAYLVCENDKAIPVAVQDALVEGARKEGAEVVVERVAASHSPYISQPKAVADFLLRAAGGH